MREFVHFARGLWSGWIRGMSTTGGIFLAAASGYVTQEHYRAALGVVAALSLLASAFGAWRDEHRRAERFANGALPRVNTLDEHLDTRVDGHVATLNDYEKKVFFKMVTEGAQPAGNMYQTVANKTMMFVRQGALLHLKEEWRGPTQRWARDQSDRWAAAELSAAMGTDSSGRKPPGE